VIRHFAFLSLFLVTGLLLCGCASTLDKLEGIGKAPPLAKVKDPTAEAEYKPLTWPLPEAPLPAAPQANSLWQPGARTFFRDGRAARVGDLLRVKINIADQAEFDNNTTSARTTQESVSAPAFFGLENKLQVLPFLHQANPSDLANINGSNSHQGNVTAKRKETVQTEVAAMVIQVLPNGNFVISGKQEFLMNYDIREVSIKGVVRPQDIGSDNTIDSTQVAEARITYGGRGQNMDAQQRRWGSQALDILSPF
jgi:flagellar L-ring protein precursor FlgH